MRKGRPLNFREVAMMAAQGISYAEIAEAMECPIGTVMSRVYRGREALRGRIKNDSTVLEMAA